MSPSSVLSTAFPVLGVSVLVAHDQNANAVVAHPVDDGVRKVSHWIGLPAIIRRRAQPGILFQQSRKPLELAKESAGKTSARFPLVEPKGWREVFRGEPVDRSAHFTSVRSSARTSSSPSRTEGSRSASASRRAATASQAASRTASATRLATTRSSRRIRSALGSSRSSDCRTSTWIPICVLASQSPQLATSTAALVLGDGM